jgi:hypothetical protein
MSTTIDYGYAPSFGLALPDTLNVRTDDIPIPVGRHTAEEIRQMYPDWDTKQPIPFEELFGCLELTPEESEAFLRSIDEGREENRRLVIEREEKERCDR